MQRVWGSNELDSFEEHEGWQDLSTISEIEVSKRRWGWSDGQGQAMERMGHRKEFGFLLSKWELLRSFKQLNKGITLAAVWRMEHQERGQGRMPWQWCK